MEFFDRKQLNESAPWAKLEFSARSFFEIGETESNLVSPSVAKDETSARLFFEINETESRV